MSDENDTSEGRRRATPDSVIERRRVREVMESIGLLLDHLQREAAVLNALASQQGLETSGRVTKLRQAVLNVRKQFDTAVLTLPEHLRDHGRVIDKRKALEALESAWKA